MIVKFISSHTHSLELSEAKYMRLHHHIASEIETKLSLDVPINHILDSIRNNICNKNDRNQTLSSAKYFHFIDRKTISNLKIELNLKSHRHCDNTTSVYHIVEELHNEQYDPILLYKRQGKVNPDIKLQKKDFILALQTNEQKVMYEKFGCNLICID